MTMTPAEVLNKLNRHHREVIFPSIFERIQFDMVAEIEYHFAIEGEGRRRRIVMKRSAFWLTHDRNPNGHFMVAYDDEEGRSMGRWLHNIIDPKAGKSGIIGYTCDSVSVSPNKTKVCEQRVTRMTDGTLV